MVLSSGSVQGSENLAFGGLLLKLLSGFYGFLPGGLKSTLRSTFTGTKNGVRIKTWLRPSNVVEMCFFRLHLGSWEFGFGCWVGSVAVKSPSPLLSAQSLYARDAGVKL
ncbi:hypothetical protein U1Q18_005047 [Sarracenia purpurea var. burkii]